MPQRGTGAALKVGVIGERFLRRQVQASRLQHAKKLGGPRYPRNGLERRVGLQAA